MSSQVEELPVREHYLDKSQAQYWNWRLVDVNGLFGKRAISGGFHLSMRAIGFYNFTYYQMQKEANWVVQNGGPTTKILGGVEIGYRKTMGNLSLFFIAGVNSCLNQESSTFIKWNPFFKPTIYFGKKTGGSLSLYYEKYIGNTYSNATQDNFKLDLKTQQLEVCLGLYLARGE